MLKGFSSIFLDLDGLLRLPAHAEQDFKSGRITSEVYDMIQAIKH